MLNNIKIDTKSYVFIVLLCREIKKRVETFMKDSKCFNSFIANEFHCMNQS